MSNASAGMMLSFCHVLMSQLSGAAEVARCASLNDIVPLIFDQAPPRSYQQFAHARYAASRSPDNVTDSRCEISIAAHCDRSEHVGNCIDRHGLAGAAHRHEQTPWLG
jgi:hypothetical protein